MRILTVMTAISVPLSFLTGLNGMNFGHMPELAWRYGYFMLLGMMLALVAGMLYMFRPKRWLEASPAF
ncbi:hypothetical protein OM427_25100 [Halomonas sp. 18H]|uniref:CorA family divalent cation transporter n=1 Tax=Halomonas almeriensis TaxID=308163 RepID=UPI00222FA020|nr:MULTISPECIES: CorA family divalent cation transporter [Halomonas]MCW4152796.1 hypothetical protein [Halomonas sp. 18H]MDN3552004.1 CorA family divalent cation transporter [Halomonas almeriensis]